MKGNQIKRLKVIFSGDYTPLRKIYAWVGFFVCAIAAIGLLVALATLNQYAVNFINQ